jgi:hypothetical protein
MPKDMTALQWLAPSMARDGLITNSDWIPSASATAVTLFSDRRLHLPATLLAALHPFAVDYIKQAPALVLAATWDARLMYREERLKVARRFIAECSGGPRLNELMKAYGLATPLRALSGHALRYKHWGVLKGLSSVPAMALAPCIPHALGAQRNWLEAVACWRQHMGRFHDGELFLGWAAANLGDDRFRRSITDIADFAGNNRTAFNTRWTLAQAKAASDRWHAEIARRPFGLAAMAADWQVTIDYAPLPSQLVVDGFAFQALQTREAIYVEGERMHHCVRTYADRVVAGYSRLYSVRQGGERVATLELRKAWRSGSPLPRYELAQLKGPCNARVSRDVAAAVTAFVRRVNDFVVSRSAPSPAASAAQPPANLQPIQFSRRVRVIDG